MNLKGEFKGLKSLAARLEKFNGALDKAALRALGVGALRIHETAVKSIQNKTGTRKRGRMVSNPGEPPNTQTGRLVRSIRFTLDATKLSAVVGTNLLYGAYLEFGAKKINLAPRPWLRPAFMKHKAEIVKDLNKEVRRILKGFKG